MIVSSYQQISDHVKQVNCIYKNLSNITNHKTSPTVSISIKL
jgi:hypothetical protein